jgi:RNase P/RNase MRP subunit POP5
MDDNQKDVLIKVLRTQLETKDEQITALMLIREHYERRFGIRMMASGKIKDLRRGEAE